MAGRYSKTHSNYIIKTPHQDIKGGGKILERDWVTIGSQHQIEKGKKPYYSDTNFLFTDNIYPSYKKRHNYGKWVAHWDYDDVKNANSDINNVIVNSTSNDIRDFAYYGSAVELVQSSILNIIKTFPARVTVSPNDIYYPNEEGGYGKLDGWYLLDNPFEVDFVHELIGKDVSNNNVDRFLMNSYLKYEINGVDISSYNVINRKFMKKLNSSGIEEWNTFADNKIDEAERNGWVLSKFCGKNWLPTDGEPLYSVFINNNETIYGYIINDKPIEMTKNSNLKITSKNYIFDEYFNNLDGFERQLLTLKSKPVYKNSFITPIENELDYRYVYRDYTWPSYNDGNNHFYIDVISQSFTSYVQKLIDMATIFDELWCDNLYRNMTHESIKNFDWTYTKEYTDGDEQDNIDGGNRMMQLLRIYGRAFDDLKRLSDGIGFTNTNTYDAFNNQPEAEITDKLDITGWDITSIIPNYDNLAISDIVIDSNFLEDYVKNIRHNKWFDSFNLDSFTSSKADIEFTRRLLLSSKRIFQTKGTKHAIDMVMGIFGFGDNDYILEEPFYYTTPKNYDDNIELIENINNNKLGNRIYDDVYSGIPLKDIFIGNNHYIVPYYTRSRKYDGDFVFESKGGWGKQDNGDYMETLSYLHVVGEFGDLLKVNPNSLSGNDIYYVVSLASYNDYKEGEISSNFFILKDGSINASDLPESWENINLKDESKAAKRANYLDGIISSNIGNNPHVGYGNYDCGNEYRNYMRQPFKYSVDTYSFVNSDWYNEAKNFTFKIIDNGEIDKEKIKVMLDDSNEDYYLNRKVLKIINNLDNQMFKDYFKNVILKYLMQVIPSTTILILEKF